MKRKILTLALCLAVSIFCALAVGCNAESEPLKPTDDNAFVINNSGVITDMTATGKMLSTVVVPDEINGIKVKEIGQKRVQTMHEFGKNHFTRRARNNSPLRV